MADPIQDQPSIIAPDPAVLAETTTFRGWQAVRLSNGLVEAIVVPDIGGRVMALNLGGYAYLWVNPALAGKLFSAEENQGDGTLAAWKNYGGSKTWPAPQGWSNETEWHGPPDSVLDTGRYTLEDWGVQNGVLYVRVSSPPDERTGVRITRQLSLPPGGTRARLCLEMKNISPIPRQWSLWDVVQLNAACSIPEGETHNEQAWVYIPANPESAFPGGYRVLFGSQENPEWQRIDGLIAAQYLYQVGKIAVDSPTGWIAFVNQAEDFAFIQRFTVFFDEPYPDGGATVECWTTGLGESVGGLDYERDPLYHVEAEVLGPLRTMQPGECQSVEIEWCACRCPGPIVQVNSAGCANALLTADPVDGGIRLRGVFGVFAPGTVQLEWRDLVGSILRTEPIAIAHPLDVLRLDLVRVPPPGWTSAELHLVGENQSRVLLDTVEKNG